jgi:hypothetical protein
LEEALQQEMALMLAELAALDQVVEVEPLQGGKELGDKETQVV